MLRPHHAQPSSAKWLIDAVAAPDPAAPVAVLRCHQLSVGRQPAVRDAVKDSPMARRGTQTSAFVSLMRSF
ncbi:hypothetical protein D7U76_12680 [Stenotrophomonas maltophilia]|nr:hypothetical protein [Stenotrophomonas maltophilia]